MGLANENSIQGKIQRRWLAGERLNAHDVAKQYGCHFTNLSVAKDVMGKTGYRFHKQYEGDGRWMISLESGPGYPAADELAESSPVEDDLRRDELAELRARVQVLEDAVLTMALDVVNALRSGGTAA